VEDTEHFCKVTYSRYDVSAEMFWKKINHNDFTESKQNQKVNYGKNLEDFPSAVSICIQGPSKFISQ
jgi:hypothetical protein